MPVTSVVRARGGTAERTVQLSDIVIYDFRTAFLFAPGPDWMEIVEQYYEDLGMLLGAARAQLKLPEEFFVPDLWHHSIQLRPEEGEAAIDMWSLGHDLAKGLGYKRGIRMDRNSNQVIGAIYVLPSPS